MKFKEIQKLIDKGIMVLSDNDDKRNEERYIKLQEAIEESQDFIEKNNYSLDVDEELRNELKFRIAAFRKDKIIFILFLIILCGLLFIGVFYISYSHFYDHWYDGGHFIPPKTTTKVEKPSDNDHDFDDKTHHHSSKTSTTKKNTISTLVEPEEKNAFVTIIFDNSSLLDIENMLPMDDSVGLTTTPTTWKLDSTLSNGSKDYKILYTIDFIDKVSDIPSNELLDVSKLKYQLLIKKEGQEIYNSNVQLMKDYPDVENGVRPIITGETYNNDETLDFELRMWLDSSTENSEQGKKYRFNINVEATYEFIE